MYTTLISATQLRSLLEGEQPRMIFDCSFELMQAGAGDQQYQQAHVVGAVRADLERHLSAAPDADDAASGGRHPLPSREGFAVWLGKIGFTQDMQAVVYDRQGANYCARLWWMLKWAGHENVAVLNGGLQAWQAIGGQTEGVNSAPELVPAPDTHYALAPARVELVDADRVTAQLGRPSQTLLDARGAPHFRGEVEPLDPVAGHIPGALNRPFNLNMDDKGQFKPADTLRAEFEVLLAGHDAATVVHHCGSGVSAIPNIIAMEIAGLGRTALYAGSWSDWCSEPTRPTARG